MYWHLSQMQTGCRVGNSIIGRQVVFKGHCGTALASQICYVHIFTLFFGFGAWQIKIDVFEPIGSSASSGSSGM